MWLKLNCLVLCIYYVSNNKNLIVDKLRNCGVLVEIVIKKVMVVFIMFYID